MRSAGLPVESIIEYVKLFQEGDETIPARLQLLVEQRKNLLDQMEQMNVTLKRLNYKIDRYETAVKTVNYLGIDVAKVIVSKTK